MSRGRFQVEVYIYIYDRGHRWFFRLRLWRLHPFFVDNDVILLNWRVPIKNNVSQAAKKRLNCHIAKIKLRHLLVAAGCMNGKVAAFDST